LRLCFASISATCQLNKKARLTPTASYLVQTFLRGAPNGFKS
jgi:hypothetical protein